MNGKRVLLLTLLAAAALLPWQSLALAAVSVESGYDPAAELKAAVMFRNFNSSMEPAEIFLGKGGLPYDGRIEHNFYEGLTCSGSNPIGAWQPTNHVRFVYDPTAETIRTEVQASHAYCVQYSAGNLGVLNYVMFTVARRMPAGTLTLRNVVLNGEPLGDFMGGAGTDATGKKWYVSGLDLSGGFVIEGDLVLTGFQPGGETNFVEIAAGVVGSPDIEAPITRSVAVSPDPAYVNGEATVTAILDDTNTGDSAIATAEYSLNGAAWMPMASSDSGFDASQEEVTATFPVSKIGVNTVCVRGTDAYENTGNPTCATFVVGYTFDGFFSPIESDTINHAKAGQAVPTKWRLTDANGAPIANPGSFAGLHSYAVDCQTLTGDPAAAADEVAAGHSGLQYLGDGYWQFNWKTPKQYRGSCRAMYVEFDSTLTSPVVIFEFR